MSTVPNIPHIPIVRRSQSGAALIVVLSILVLLTAVMVAFMVSTRDDLNATIQYAAGERVHALSEEAVSLVMGQIREATLSTVDSDGKGIKAWASQPGALRVWDDNGHFEQLYKLYSAKQMKEDSLDFLNDEIPSDWRSRPDEYTDLNEPVLKQARTGTRKTWHYPIMNPAAIGVVDGFSSEQSQVGNTSTVGDTRTSMPVHWLYMSRSGKLTNTLQDKKSGDPSVGRIAFWTDDETSKVNINTASANANNPTIYSTGNGMPSLQNKLGYSFWTTPHSRLMQDYNMGRSNLRQGEFQRYTAHPASVNLLAVLKGTSFDSLTEAQKLNTLRDVFSLFPRYRWGASENGRYSFGQTPDVDLTGENQRHDRLYDSVDELLFSPDRSVQTFPSLTSGLMSDAERANAWRFFLTTSSRAPDLNLFGQPRVSLWPLHTEDDDKHRTVYDRMIARCTTVGSVDGNHFIYYFQRQNPFSSTEDWEQILRNQSLFHYLQNFTKSGVKIPGFGGNFETKYDLTNGGVIGEWNQILTEMFDYIRVANLNETYAGRPSTFKSYTPDFPPNWQTDIGLLADSGPNGLAGSGMVLPIETSYGRGAGRVPTLSEVMVFVIQPATETDDDGVPRPTDTVRPAVYFETFSPMQGLMPWTSRNFQINAKTNMRLNNYELFPGASSAAGVTSLPYLRTTAVAISQALGGTDGFMMGFGGASTESQTGYMVKYPFAYRDYPSAITDPIPAVDPILTLSSSEDMLAKGNIDITFKMDGIDYQTFSLEIPGTTLPKPDPVVATGPYWQWYKRLVPSNHMGVFPEDVAHSLVPRDGDYRIMAYLKDVPKGFFRPHPDFGSSKHFAHTIRFKRERGWAGAAGGTWTKDGGSENGTLVGLPYYKDLTGGGTSSSANGSILTTYYPDIPPDITDLVKQKGWEGDWDNGVGDFPDGAYLNKPDEGQLDKELNTPNYFDITGWSPAVGLFSPTLQMSSAMVFGSLSTAVRRTYKAYTANDFSAGRPWRTLLFCPNPDYEISSSYTHYGATTPPDYLLADLFNMPVVEPYPISEPLSTAGRINMNYQILPFTDIKRTTGLIALFGGQKIGALPNSLSENYKQGAVQYDSTKVYHDIDPVETLKQFEERFDNNDVFRSASEISSLFLIPQGTKLTNIKNWWKDYRLTGDNMREKPYATMYPLLTTKSNTYTVHMRVQTLAEGTMTVTGEYRGSSTIERYVDPADNRIGTEINPDTQSLEPLYRFRVVDTKRFAP